MANATAAKATSIQPRFIRFGDAPGYLGMCNDEFNKTVRPNVREFPIGKQGVAFDRHELDEWADAYIAAKAIEKAAKQDNNRPRSERQGATQWREKRSLVSTRKVASGKSTRSSVASDFEKALELVTGKKQSSI
ncbi:putative DNA-binding transcriptional regulator AlpA [Pseudomonas chlororaphis]